MNFIRRIVQNNADEWAHKKFVRFSLGDFEREEIIIKAGSTIQVSAGFEYLDVLLGIVSRLAKEDVIIKGKLAGKRKLSADLSNFGIEPKKISGKEDKADIDCVLPPPKFEEFFETFRDVFMLLTVKSGKYSVNPKKSIPKPGKLVEKFVTAKLDKSDYDLIKQEFLFDFEGKFKEARIKQVYKIMEIKVPKEYEKDFEKARTMATRKGKIIRNLIIDGKEFHKEYDFEV